MFKVGKLYKLNGTAYTYECLFVTRGGEVLVQCIESGSKPTLTPLSFDSFTEVKPVSRGWVNVWRDSDKTPYIGSHVYRSLENAKAVTDKAHNYVDTIEIVYDPNKETS